jgi:hypothetical protein
MLDFSDSFLAEGDVGNRYLPVGNESLTDFFMYAHRHACTGVFAGFPGFKSAYFDASAVWWAKSNPGVLGWK